MHDSPPSHPRPLSPHLQVYRLPMTALMSVTHRVTGAALTLGLLLVATVFIAGMMGEEAFTRVVGLASSPLGLLVLLAWSLALFYHWCNGVRHLIWDTGVGYKKSSATASGWLVILATLILTGGTWYMAGVFEEDFYGQYATIADDLTSSLNGAAGEVADVVVEE